MTYVRKLSFEEAPDYDYLRGLFSLAFKEAGNAEDGEYDWVKIGKGRVEGADLLWAGATTLPVPASGSIVPSTSQQTQQQKPVTSIGAQAGKRARTESVPTPGSDQSRVRRPAPCFSAPGVASTAGLEVIKGVENTAGGRGGSRPVVAGRGGSARNVQLRGQRVPEEDV